MDSEKEVDAYASAAAQSYLEGIDRSFVDHVGRLFAARAGVSGEALDVGCGPGQIPIMMAKRWPQLRIAAIDAAPAMIDQARKDAAAAGVDIGFEVLRIGPEGMARLPYADASFDLVTCNSTLHHLADPLQAFDEIARVARPEGAVLIRDLSRPLAPLYPLHVRLFGRHYSGEMRRLYVASVRAAYTIEELEALRRGSRLDDGRCRVFKRGRTHLGIERPALP
jgi:ubiquinone/menaquinone biosynthesis C-methylase UbiE